MTKTNRHILFGNRLLQYSALSGAFILGKPDLIFAEVVYTNVEPDVVLDENFEAYSLDIDNNSMFDFKLINRTFYFGGYWTSGSINYIPYQRFERQILSVYNGNIAAGKSVDFGSTSSELLRALPYAINFGNIIFNSLQFINDDQQLLAFKSEISLLGEFGYYGGYWYPEQLNHYLGIYFVDADEINHYGWIRCDVKDDGRALVIKDYAYETEPDYPIIAGDTTHYVNINTGENQIDATAYSFGKDIYVISKTFQSIEIKVYDLIGREINSSHMQNEMEIINMSKCASGVYLVKLIQGSSTVEKKVIIG